MGLLVLGWVTWMAEGEVKEVRDFCEIFVTSSWHPKIMWDACSKSPRMIIETCSSWRPMQAPLQQLQTRSIMNIQTHALRWDVARNHPSLVKECHYVIDLCVCFQTIASPCQNIEKRCTLSRVSPRTTTYFGKVVETIVWTWMKSAVYIAVQDSTHGWQIIYQESWQMRSTRSSSFPSYCPCLQASWPSKHLTLRNTCLVILGTCCW